WEAAPSSVLREIQQIPLLEAAPPPPPPSLTPSCPGGRGPGPGGRRVARGARRRGRAASPRARTELQRDGARTEAPRPAEGAAAPRRRGCGLRGAGPGGGARAPACASRGGREGVRASAAPRRPPARARSPPRGLSPPTAPRERGARVARRAPSLGLRRRPPRRPSLSGRRGRRSGGRGGARPGALSTGPGGLGAAGAGRGAAAAAWAVPARGECGGAEPALPAGVGGRRGDGAGERAAGAGASLAAPPPPASPGKFVGVPASGISVAGQRSTRPSVNRELELEEEEEEEDAEEARPHPVRDASLVEGSGGFWDIFLGPFPPRFPHLDRQLRQIVTNGSKTRFLEVRKEETGGTGALRGKTDSDWSQRKGKRTHFREGVRRRTQWDIRPWLDS
ncbi:major ampullate spidroin 2, partial [Lynx pardinus]